ncbi:MAG TPA: glycosyltransferase family 39 protein, partial [Candidatus Caenarcaniphilales bacterium]
MTSIHHSIKALLHNGFARSALLRGLAISGLLLIGWLAFFRHLGSTGLVDETEPLFVEAARQMRVTGNWITPFFNGEPRFDKPPLIYWLMAIAFKIFGVNEGAARFPSALAAFLLTSFCFYTLRHFGFTQFQTGSPSPQGSRKSQARELAVQTFPMAAGQATALRAPEEIGVWRQPLPRQLWVSAALGAVIVAFNLKTLFWGRIG